MSIQSWQSAWLDAVSRLGGDLREVYLQLDDPLRDGHPIELVWPSNKPGTQISMLVEAAESALQTRGPIVRSSARQRVRVSAAAIPLEVGAGRSGPSGVLAVLVDCPDGAEPQVAAKRALERVKAVAAATELVFQQAKARARLAATLSAVAAVLEWKDCRAAATAVATELALALDCKRISVGFRIHDDIQLEAVSHTSTLSRRSRWAELLTSAMEEACDQDRSVAAPLSAELPRVANLAHTRLCESEGTGSAFTVPFAVEGRVVGAFTFEESRNRAPSRARIELCEDLVGVVGPTLELRRRVRDSLPRKIKRALGLGGEDKDQGTRNRRLGVLAALAALAFSLLPGDFRVTAQATLEGRVQRAVTAGVAGFLTEANARPGDLVRKGALLARFEDRELDVEQRNWIARRDQMRREYRDAMSRNDRSEATILDARAAQARAEIDLIAAKLERTRVIAPFDGVVVKGDWSQSLGAPVERGELLFEIAPLDGYRIVLNVDERDIAHVHVGQVGKLALSAFPGISLDLEVRRIMPVSLSGDGRTYFRVEADLERRVPGLRPGMEGVAKVEIGERQRLWIWTRPIVDAARLMLWRVSW